MPDPVLTVALCVLGYLLGSIPFGLILTKAAGLGDIRAIGSGNIGATNVLRTGRKPLAAATLVLDGLKGAAAVLIAAQLSDRTTMLYAGLAAVLGHLFPVWLRFSGGKGVATGLGVLLAAAWPAGIAACGAWLIGTAVTRISSVGALAAFAAAPIVALAMGDAGLLKLSFTIAVLVFLRHHENIRRLMAGTEPKVGQREPESA